MTKIAEIDNIVQKSTKMVHIDFRNVQKVSNKVKNREKYIKIDRNSKSTQIQNRSEYKIGRNEKSTGIQS